MISERVETSIEDGGPVPGAQPPGAQPPASECRVSDNEACPAVQSILVENISKAYKLYDRPADRLKEALHPFNKTYHRLFYALKDVSFAVQQGESVGILGSNGAGKSTLLKIITGVLTPSSGNISVNGQISALLELGTGFNQELTGLENIFFNGAIMGFSRAQMEVWLDEILSFADIGDFIHQPMKIYSSGMVMRLAFAVNVCVEPQIMIVDEILAVGDAPFSAKCFTRLRKLIDSGVTMLFTSHDIGTVRSICSRALWIDEGKTKMWGSAVDVCREYEKACWRKQGVTLDVPVNGEVADSGECTCGAKDSGDEAASDTQDKSGPPHEWQVPPELFLPNPDFALQVDENRYGTKAIVINNFLLANVHGEIKVSLDPDETIYAHYLLQINESLDTDVIIGIRVKDIRGIDVFSCNDLYNEHHVGRPANSSIKATFCLKFPLSQGKYYIHTALFGFQDGTKYVNGRYDYGRAILYDVIESAYHFEVRQYKKFGLAGPVHVDGNLVFY